MNNNKTRNINKFCIQYVLFIFIITVFSFKSYTQNPDWLWAKSADGVFSYCTTAAMETDLQGNIYVAGAFDGPTLVFDTITIYNTSASGEDVFIVKFDPLGNVLWANGAGGQYSDFIHSLAVDSSGNVFIAGDYSNSDIFFGSLMLPYTPGTSMFVVKYDTDGNPLWAKSSSSIDSYATSVKAGSDGALYLAGNYSTLQFSLGSVSLNNTNGSNTYDCFMAKLDQNGNTIWAKTIGGDENEIQPSIALNASNDIYLTAVFNSFSFDIDGHVVNLTSGPYTESDIFLVKFNTGGQALWVKSINGSGDDFVNSIDSDLSGNVFVTGDFLSANLNVGTVTLSNTDSTTTDIFIAKYDANGNVLWAKRAGGNSDDIGSTIAADVMGNVYLTGSYFDSVITFGSLMQNTWPLYILKLDAAGNELWLKGAENNGGYGYCITSDIFGSVIVSGGFSSDSIAFDSLICSGTPSDYDCFVLKAGSVPATFLYNNVICYGESNGSATAIPGGGVPTYSYLWNTNPPQTTQTATGLSSGTYSVTISDTQNYFSIGYVTISQPGQIISENNVSICQGDTLFFGAEAYMTEGIYSDTLVSLSGCDSISKINLSINPLPQIPATPVGETLLCLDEPLSDYTTSVSDSSIVLWNIIPSQAGSVINPTHSSCIIAWGDSDYETASVFITATNSCGTINSDTLEILRENCDCNVYIPNIFSPNNDGENDVFYIRSNCAEEFECIIYDRWGNKIFESHDVNTGWDGNVKVSQAESGVYVYYVFIRMPDGTSRSFAGNVTLCR